MTTTILNFLLFFGPLFSFIIALGQLIQKRKGTMHLLYTFSFFGLSIWMFQMCLYATGIFDEWEYIYYVKVLPVPLIFMVPPLMVLRYKWIISNKFNFRFSHVLLFVPAIAALALLCIPLFHPSITCNKEYVVGRPIISRSYMELPLYFKAIYASFMLPKLFNTIIMTPILIAMAPVWGKSEKSMKIKISRIGYIFAGSIVSSNALAVIGDFVSIPLLKGAMLIANFFTCLVYLMTQRHPDYNRLLKIETRKAHYERSRIQGLDINKIIDRLHEIMDGEKAFADEDLSLKDLADELGIGPHQLSQILNEKLNKNFSTFVNEYRINEAKKMLVEELDRSILSVGAAVGFNSNTTFITSFSRLVGISPSQYRKAHTQS